MKLLTLIHLSKSEMHVPIIEDFDNFKRYFQKLKHLYCQMEGLNAVH